MPSVTLNPMVTWDVFGETTSRRDFSRLLCIAMLLVSVCVAEDAPRKIKRQVQPQYPELAKRSGMSGTVRLQLLVGKDGGIKAITAVGGNPLLIVAAENAVKQWQYEPGPEASQMVEFHFSPLR